MVVVIAARVYLSETSIDDQWDFEDRKWRYVSTI